MHPYLHVPRSPAQELAAITALRPNAPLPVEIPALQTLTPSLLTTALQNECLQKELYWGQTCDLTSEAAETHTVPRG